MSNLLHSFSEVHNSVVPFTSHSKLHEFGAEKPISWAKRAHFDLEPKSISTVLSMWLQTAKLPPNGVGAKISEGLQEHTFSSVRY
jgi:hypothetical protein